MRAVQGVALAAVWMVIMAACHNGPTLASAIQRADFDARAASDSDVVSVRVENNDFPDVDVYLVTEGNMRVRLGTANGHTVTTLIVPKSYVPMASELRFITRPIGGGSSSMTDPMMVSPGEEVVLTILSSG
jgi:hypothetical protein